MDTKIVGGKIAQARKAVNMSQAQLARQMFISPQAVGKWERGESMPDITTFSRLAEMLGVDLNYFSENGPSGDDKTPSSQVKLREADSLPDQPERQLQINLNSVDLQKGDFAGVTLHNGKFKTSPMHGANFAGADLTGSLFDVIDAHDANFAGANLTDCRFSITDLTGASFHKSVLVRTTLHMSGQGAKFIDVNLKDVEFRKSDLRNTTFENCIFNGVHFNQCDLRGICFDEKTFIGVKFNKSSLNNVSFKGAALRNVSFTLPFSVTNKSYLAMKTVCFDGSIMDKLTYLALKGLRVVDLSTVTII